MLSVWSGPKFCRVVKSYMDDKLSVWAKELLVAVSRPSA